MKKKGIAILDLDGRQLNVRLNYTAYEKFEEKFGMSLVKYFQTIGEDVSLSVIGEIIFIMLEAGKNPLERSVLFDELDVCDTDKYVKVIMECMNVSQPAVDKDKSAPLAVVPDLPKEQ